MACKRVSPGLLILILSGCAALPGKGWPGFPKYKPDVAVKKPPTVKPAVRVVKQPQTAAQVPEVDPTPVGAVPESPEFHYVHQKLKGLLSKLGEGDVGEAHLKEISLRVYAMIKVFQGRRRAWFQKSLVRGQKYLPMLRSVSPRRTCRRSWSILP